MARPGVIRGIPGSVSGLSVFWAAGRLKNQTKRAITRACSESEGGYVNAATEPGTFTERSVPLAGTRPLSSFF